jgi:hypothetical protein
MIGETSQLHKVANCAKILPNSFSFEIIEQVLDTVKSPVFHEDEIFIALMEWTYWCISSFHHFISFIIILL